MRKLRWELQIKVKPLVVVKGFDLTAARIKAIVRILGISRDDVRVTRKPRPLVIAKLQGFPNVKAMLADRKFRELAGPQ